MARVCDAHCMRWSISDGPPRCLHVAKHLRARRLFYLVVLFATESYCPSYLCYYCRPSHRYLLSWLPFVWSTVLHCMSCTQNAATSRIHLTLNSHPTITFLRLALQDRQSAQDGQSSYGLHLFRSHARSKGRARAGSASRSTCSLPVLSQESAATKSTTGFLLRRIPCGLTGQADQKLPEHSVPNPVHGIPRCAGVRQW